MTTCLALCAAGLLLLVPLPAPPARRIAPAARPADQREATGRRGVLLAVGATAAGCLAAGGVLPGAALALVLAPAAGAVVVRTGRAQPAYAPDRSVALTADLAAAVLRSGSPLTVALEAAAPAASPSSAALLRRVAGLSRLGGSAADAWALVPAGHPLEPLARAAVRSADSGSRLADAFERYARDVRAETAARAAARAQRAGVTALAPLAACFLPSFVCLGIVPVVIGLGRSALGVSA